MVRDTVVSVSVCLFFALLSVSPFAHLKNHTFKFDSNCLHMLPVAVAWSYSDGNAICYVLPVLWMTVIDFCKKKQAGDNFLFFSHA